MNARAEFLKCRRCDPKKTFHQNALVSFAYCGHRRIGIAKPREWGAWHLERNITPCQFADLVLTIALYNASDPDFWKRELPAGGEGMK
jgi:hypothetical protein